MLAAMCVRACSAAAGWEWNGCRPFHKKARMLREDPYNMTTEHLDAIVTAMQNGSHDEVTTILRRHGVPLLPAVEVIEGAPKWSCKNPADVERAESCMRDLLGSRAIAVNNAMSFPRRMPSAAFANLCHHMDLGEREHALATLASYGLRPLEPTSLVTSSRYEAILVATPLVRIFKDGFQRGQEPGAEPPLLLRQQTHRSLRSLPARAPRHRHGL